MSDTTNPVNTAQGSTPTQVKKQLFGGNQEVFDNLEKFEQLTNPTGEEDVDFAFEDLLDQEENAEAPTTQELSENEYHIPESQPTIEAPLTTQAEEFYMPENEDQPAVENVFMAADQAPIDEGIGESASIEEEKADVSEDILPDVAQDISEMEVSQEIEEEKFPEYEEEKTSESNFSSFSVEPLSTEDTENKEDYDTSEETLTPNTANLEEPLSNNNTKEEMSENEGAIENTPLVADQSNAELLAHQKLEEEPEIEGSKFVKKFSKLLEMTKSIFELEKELTNQEILDFELIGSNTQKSMVRYVVSEVPRNQETMLQIKRIEKNYSDNSESEHILYLLTKQKHNNLMVIIDDFPLYEEEKDLSDPIKASIVNEKLNKFDLLFSEKLKPLNQQVLLKKEAEEKEKTFRTVFRDF